MLDFLEIFDLFGYSKFVTFNNRFSLKTKLGGLISIIVLISILFLSFLLLKDLYLRKYFRLTVYDEIILDIPLKITDIPFHMHINYLSKDGKNYKLEELIDFQVEIKSNNRSYKGDYIKKCKNLKNTYYDQFDLEKNFLNKAYTDNDYCLYLNDSTISLHTYPISEENFDSININTLFCNEKHRKDKNLTSCQPAKVLDGIEMIVNYHFFQDYPLAKNITYPKYTKMEGDLSSFDYNGTFSSTNSYYIKRTFINSLEDMIIPKVKRYQLLNYIKSDDEYLPTFGFNILIYLQPYTITYDRNYDNLFDTLSKIGGFLKAIKYFSVYIKYFYRKYFLYDLFEMIGKNNEIPIEQFSRTSLKGTKLQDSSGFKNSKESLIHIQPATPASLSSSVRATSPMYKLNKCIFFLPTIFICNKRKIKNFNRIMLPIMSSISITTIIDCKDFISDLKSNLLTKEDFKRSNNFILDLKLKSNENIFVYSQRQSTENFKILNNQNQDEAKENRDSYSLD